jgi:hypothetical protein
VPRGFHTVPAPSIATHLGRASQILKKAPGTHEAIVSATARPCIALHRDADLLCRGARSITLILNLNSFVIDIQTPDGNGLLRTFKFCLRGVNVWAYLAKLSLNTVFISDVINFPQRRSIVATSFVLHHREI